MKEEIEYGEDDWFGVHVGHVGVDVVAGAGAVRAVQRARRLGSPILRTRRRHGRRLCDG